MMWRREEESQERMVQLSADDVQKLLAITSRSGLSPPEVLHDLIAGAVLIETRVSDVRPGDKWFLEGAWVEVTRVDVGHPDDRVRVDYLLDEEDSFDCSYRGFEVAIVKRGATDATWWAREQLRQERGPGHMDVIRHDR